MVIVRMVITLTIIVTVFMSVPLASADDLDREYQMLFLRYTQDAADSSNAYNRLQKEHLNVLKGESDICAKSVEAYGSDDNTFCRSARSRSKQHEEKVENAHQKIKDLEDKKEALKIKVMERNKGKLPEWWKEPVN
ncbi:MAG: hypothetical protein ABSD38_37525 [Syntrophorhabdales bacterium]|jgi:hypothetical protein